MREAYGPMGRGGMPGYGTMPYGMQSFGQSEGRKRRRPPSLLLDESPLKVTLRVNSIKRVHPEKDNDDAFAALEKAKEEAEKKGEEGEDEEQSLIGVDEDEDGWDAWDEKITGHSDNDATEYPTQEEVDEAQAEIDAESDNNAE